MIKIQNYIKCYENIIDDDVCDEIINQKDLEFYPATVDDGKLAKHRNCLSKHLDSKFDKILFEIIADILTKYSSEFSCFKTGLTTEDTGYDHLLYLGSHKGEYKEHTDHSDLHPRVLREHIIKKKAGSAVVFPSNFCFPHAVTPVTNGDRHSIITWIH